MRAVYPVLFLLLMASCDPAYHLEYHVHNNLTQNIQVVYTAYQEDTITVLVEAGQTMLIFSHDGLGSVDDDRYKDALENVRIQTDDTLVSVEESQWLYKEFNNHEAQYILDVDSILF